MFMFTFFAIPTFALFVHQWHDRYSRHRLVLNVTPLLKGMLWFVPALLLLMLLYRPTPASYRSPALFFHFFLQEHGLFLLLALAGYLLFFGSYRGGNGFIQALFFLTGFYALSMLFYYIRNFGNFNSQLVFLLPLSRCLTIFLGALFFDKFLEADLKGRILYTFFLLLTIALLSFISLLFATRYTVLATGVSFISLGISFPIYHFVKDL